MSSLGALQLSLNTIVLTGAVGLFGAEALAGYGIASRLDFLLIPVMFGLGTAVVTMTGTNVGAGNLARARRISWTAVVIAAAFTGGIGVVVAAVPSLWLGVFTRDPMVLATGAAYLRHVGPLYGAMGVGMQAYFAMQGYGRVLWPFLAGFVRLALAAGLGWLAVARFGAGLPVLFSLIAASAGAFALMNVATLLRVGSSSPRGDPAVAVPAGRLSTSAHLRPPEPTAVDRPWTINERRCMVDAKVLIREQLVVTQQFLKRCLSDISDDESRRMPDATLSPIIWQVGHLAAINSYLVRRVGGAAAAEPARYRELFKTGTGGSAAYPPLDAIVAACDSTHEALVRALAEANLDAPNESSAGFWKDVGGLFSFANSHRWYHIGKIMTLRALLGKPRILG